MSSCSPSMVCQYFVTHIEHNMTESRYIFKIHYPLMYVHIQILIGCTYYYFYFIIYNEDDCVLYLIDPPSGFFFAWFSFT